MTPTTRNRIIAVIALCVAGGTLSYISLGGIGENLVYYWNVPELLSQGEKAYGATIRLAGLVEKNSVDWNQDTLRLQFRVSGTPEEGGDQTVAIESTGVPPQMFQEGIGVVVEGTYDGKVFRSERLMVKHSNEYRPPEKGESPEELYKTLLEES